MGIIGRRIREIREREVWGQAELARAAGISIAGLWQIEHDKREPRPATIRKIADVLGVPAQEFINGTVSENTTPDGTSDPP